MFPGDFVKQSTGNGMRLGILLLNYWLGWNGDETVDQCFSKIDAIHLQSCKIQILIKSEVNA